MSYLNALINQQGKLILNDRRYAIFLTILFSVVPFMQTLSLVVLAFVVLNKGWIMGLWLVMPLFCLEALRFNVSMGIDSALLNTFLSLIPCYLAAGVLHASVSWRVVFVFFFLLLTVVVTFLQALNPSFILLQLSHMKQILESMQEESPFLDVLKGLDAGSLDLVANYFFGMELLAHLISALVPLIMARYMQSQLVYPKGFAEEILFFRADRVGFLMLLCCSLAAMSQHWVAIDLLPFMVFYFVLAGLSFIAYFLAYKKRLAMFSILLVFIFVLPFVALPMVVFVGILDCFMNLRLYLPLI